MAIRQDIGIVTAYGYAVSKGYTGTEEEFAQAMANAGITLDSITDAVDQFLNTTVPTAVQTVQNEGDTQVTNVQDAGTEQIAAVNEAGTTQVGNVNTAGDNQVSAIQAKGEETIESIPSDYTDLSNEVNDLKNALTNETNARILLAGRVTTAEGDIDTLETHKVAQPLDEYNQPTNGTSGQSLRTKGDGSTEWVDEGLPTDAQTAAAISAWLALHPEATTTVQDGSLTDAKFSAELKLKALKDYVTPQMYGAKGDGIADDTDAIQAAIDSGKYVLLPYGTYLISRTIEINTGLQGSLSFVGMGSEILGNPPTDRPRKVIIKAATSFIGSALFELTSARNCYFANFSAECGRSWDNYVMGGSTTLDNVFVLTNSPYNKFEAINFKGANAAAFKVIGTTYTNSFYNCAFSASDIGYDSHECPDHCTTWFYNCRFEGNEVAGALITGRMISFSGCAFEGGLGDGVQIGYTGISTYDIAFYSCDIEANYGYAMKFNTNVQEITYDCGQIIGHPNANNNLFYIANPINNANFMTHLSVLNQNRVIYDPTGVNVWIRGNFPDNFMDCIHVSNIYWSPLGAEKRDEFKDYSFSVDDISAPYPSASVDGGIATVFQGIKVNTGGKAVSKITGKINPVPPSGKLLVKYQRCYNKGAKSAVVPTQVTIANDGTFTIDYTSSVYGMMESLYIAPLWSSGDTTNYAISELVGKLR